MDPLLVSMYYGRPIYYGSMESKNKKYQKLNYVQNGFTPLRRELGKSMNPSDRRASSPFGERCNDNYIMPPPTSCIDLTRKLQHVDDACLNRGGLLKSHWREYESCNCSSSQPNHSGFPKCSGHHCSFYHRQQDCCSHYPRQHMHCGSYRPTAIQCHHRNHHPCIENSHSHNSGSVSCRDYANPCPHSFNHHSHFSKASKCCNREELTRCRSATCQCTDNLNHLHPSNKCPRKESPNNEGNEWYTQQWVEHSTHSVKEKKRKLIPEPLGEPHQLNDGNDSHMLVSQSTGRGTCGESVNNKWSSDDEDGFTSVSQVKPKQLQAHHFPSKKRINELAVDQAHFRPWTIQVDNASDSDSSSISDTSTLFLKQDKKLLGPLSSKPFMKSGLVRGSSRITAATVSSENSSSSSECSESCPPKKVGTPEFKKNVVPSDSEEVSPATDTQQTCSESLTVDPELLALADKRPGTLLENIIDGNSKELLQGKCETKKRKLFNYTDNSWLYDPHKLQSVPQPEDEEISISYKRQLVEAHKDFHESDDGARSAYDKQQKSNLRQNKIDREKEILKTIERGITQCLTGSTNLKETEQNGKDSILISQDLDEDIVPSSDAVATRVCNRLTAGSTCNESIFSKDKIQIDHQQPDNLIIHQHMETVVAEIVDDWSSSNSCPEKSILPKTKNNVLHDMLNDSDFESCIESVIPKAAKYIGSKSGASTDPMLSAINISNPKLDEQNSDVTIKNNTILDDIHSDAVMDFDVHLFPINLNTQNSDSTEDNDMENSRPLKENHCTNNDAIKNSRDASSIVQCITENRECGLPSEMELSKGKESLEMDVTLCESIGTSVPNPAGCLDSSEKNDQMNLALCEPEQDKNSESEIRQAESESNKTFVVQAHLETKCPGASQLSFDLEHLVSESISSTTVKVNDVEEKSNEQVSGCDNDDGNTSKESVIHRSPDSTTEGLSDEVIRPSPASTVFFDAESDNSPQKSRNQAVVSAAHDGNCQNESASSTPHMDNDSISTSSPSKDELKDIRKKMTLPNQVFGVEGELFDIRPKVTGDTSTAIIRGVCRLGCRSVFPYNCVKRYKIIDRACRVCSVRSHHICPFCKKSGHEKPLCFQFVFELHVLIGTRVLRLQVEGENASRFLGIEVKQYLKATDCSKGLIHTLQSLPCSNHQKEKQRLRGQLYIKTMERKNKVVPFLVGTRLADFKLCKNPP